jgi:hypothetical protein
MLLIEINQDGGFYSYEVTTPTMRSNYYAYFASDALSIVFTISNANRYFAVSSFSFDA